MFCGKRGKSMTANPCVSGEALCAGFGSEDKAARRQRLFGSEVQATW